MAAFSLTHIHFHYVSLSSLHNSFTSFRFCNPNSSFICLATSNKSRPSRKLMSDDELINVLREFVSTVGLPRDHVPSTKDLSLHGRKDLANIVRRRGHKRIKELLSNSAETTDGFDSLENMNGESTRSGDHEETGQEEKLDDIIEEQMDIFVYNVDSDTGTNFGAKGESVFIANGESPVSKEPTLTLQEKVENFMKYGQLDTVEDNVYGGSNLINGSTTLSYGQQSVVDGEQVIHDEGDFRHITHASNDNVVQNGTLLLPRLTAPSQVEDKFTRDSYSSAQGTEYTDVDNNLYNEAAEKENEVEINRLKHLLYQKELELSRLKEEVEKEKQALLVLQTKAEDEITKAQKLLSEKDAELLAAEESLSGLVEAKIQYSGEGDVVEVSGSFNGWHQRIKMDPQPSSTMFGPVDSRKYRLWSTTLWLYPGTYEIKFIVDGHWKIDPQRETTSKGGVENNILRVDR